MALITCPECQKEVSDHASACPTCGYPLAEKRAPASVVSTPIPLVPAKPPSYWHLAGILVGSTLLFVMCRPGHQATARHEQAREYSYIEQNENRIRSRLKDPASARFEGSFVSSKAGTHAVCGWVNARNGFGGYTALSRFVSAGPVQVVESDMATGEMDVLWERVCK